MSTLHYFQRYSQKENWLTNSTLLLFRHLYLHDHKKFEKFLNNLDQQIEIQIGPVFKQQLRGKSSVPDGSITQKPFQILIEAKPKGNLDESQLLGHIKEFKENEDNILIALTREEEPNAKQERLSKEIANAAADDISIATVFLTYESLYKSIRNLLQEYDREIIELLEDYAVMCEREEVFETKSHTMMAVSCGRSFKENKKFSIYYDPVERNHNLPFNYMGLYRNKAIQYVGKLEKIVACDLIDDQLVCNGDEYRKDFRILTKEEKERIKGIIKDTEVYNLKKGKKFFLLSELQQTKFKKGERSPAIQSKRYFNLKEIDGFKKGYSAKQVADTLNDKEW